MQVAGHNNAIEFHERWVAKAAAQDELRFYRGIAGTGYEEFACRVLEVRQGQVLLENLLEGMSAPMVVDVKPGRRRVWPLYSETKNKRMLEKEEQSGCREHGFMLSGVLLRDDAGQVLEQVRVKAEHYDRFRCAAQLKACFSTLLSRGGKLHLVWLEQLLAFLARFETFLREGNQHAFNSTSLLITTDQASGRLRVRWIDFTHYMPSAEGDPNLLEGVQSFSQFLRELEA